MQKLFKRKLYEKDSYSLEKLFHIPSSRNCRLKVYYENQKQNHLSNISYNKKKVIKKPERIFDLKHNILEVNQSIINLLSKADSFKNKSKAQYEKCKKENQLFYKRFQKLNKLKNGKKFLKKNNSVNLFPQNLNFFDEITKKYKEKKGISYSKELFDNKDIIAESPIVETDKYKMKYYYLYHFDKYANKTHLDFKNILKENKVLKPKRIEFDKLLITKFCNKLLNLTLKRSSELQKKEIPNKRNFNYKYDYISDKQIKEIKEIPKLKEEIKNLENLYNQMKDEKDDSTINTNTKDNLKELKNTHKSFYKKINNESLNETLLDLSSSKKSIKEEIKFQTNKSLINKSNKRLTLIPKPLKHTFYQKIINNRKKNERNKNKLFSHLSSSTQKSQFFNEKQMKDGRDITTPKTKATTFYSINNNKDKANLSISDNISEYPIIINNKALNDTEIVYVQLKKMPILNKESVLDATENYMKSKGFDVYKINKEIKKREFLQFFHNVKNKIDDYNCKKKLSELNYKTGREISDETKKNLKKISDLDCEISKAEKQYYLSFYKLKS